MPTNEAKTKLDLKLQAEGISIQGEMNPQFYEILSIEALKFIAMLERKFGSERKRLLKLREVVQKNLDTGAKPKFLEETTDVRSEDWMVASLPNDLLDRRVEITGPVDRKMVINGLNSGASVFMADFEDATTPTWKNMVEGQINLRDAARRNIEFTDPNSAKDYKLNNQIATLFVRPRGWHLLEKHVIVDGEAISGSLFDFGLYFFHSARELIERGSGPYFYLPKLESHIEARLWNKIFEYSQKTLGIPNGSIKATVLIENILAAFEMDEILYELREHSAGLNCGRWDYIFSFIKKFRNHGDCVLPDRARVTMTCDFLRSYSLLLIKTCHRRGVHAMGGMAAQIPIRGDEEANREALEKVRLDKEREVGDGHDGTWVAHPGLVPIAKGVFDRVLDGENQIDRARLDVEVTETDLLKVPEGEITEAGFRQNVSVGVRYLEAWLRGLGCVPIFNLMEDAATAEISRAQLWQWIKHKARFEDGQVIDVELLELVLEEELAKIRIEMGEKSFGESAFSRSAKLFKIMIMADEFEDFLTLPAYDMMLESRLSN